MLELAAAVEWAYQCVLRAREPVLIDVSPPDEHGTITRRYLVAVKDA